MTMTISSGHAYTNTVSNTYNYPLPFVAAAAPWHMINEDFSDCSAVDRFNNKATMMETFQIDANHSTAWFGTLLMSTSLIIPPPFLAEAHFGIAHGVINTDLQDLRGATQWYAVSRLGTIL